MYADELVLFSFVVNVTS